MTRNTEAPSTSTQHERDKANQKVPFYKLFSFADRLDVPLMIVGSLCAVGNGLSQPLMTVIFGKLINAFGSGDPSHIVKEVSRVYKDPYVCRVFLFYKYVYI